MPRRDAKIIHGAGVHSWLGKAAEESLRSGPFKESAARYEWRNHHSPPKNEWLTARPDEYYRVSGPEGDLVKGYKFPDGILPENAELIVPSLTERVKVELRLLKEKIFG